MCKSSQEESPDDRINGHREREKSSIIQKPWRRRNPREEERRNRVKYETKGNVKIRKDFSIWGSLGLL